MIGADVKPSLKRRALSYIPRGSPPLLVFQIAQNRRGIGPDGFLFLRIGLAERHPSDGLVILALLGFLSCGSDELSA
jgi:hypothetical protein